MLNLHPSNFHRFRLLSVVFPRILHFSPAKIGHNPAPFARSRFEFGAVCGGKSREMEKRIFPSMWVCRFSTRDRAMLTSLLFKHCIMYEFRDYFSWLLRFPSLNYYRRRYEYQFLYSGLFFFGEIFRSSRFFWIGFEMCFIFCTCIVFVLRCILKRMMWISLRRILCYLWKQTWFLN